MTVPQFDVEEGLRAGWLESTCSNVTTSTRRCDVSRRRGWRYGRWLLRVTALSALILANRTSWAQHVVYSAPEGCPTGAQQQAEIARRIPPLADGRVFQMAIRRSGREFVGELSVIEGGQVSGKRTVRSRTCAEAAQALVEFTVLALDASSEAPPLDEISRADESGHAEPSEHWDDKPPPSEPAPVEAKLTGPSRAAYTPPRHRERLRVSTTIQALVEGGLAPSESWGGRVMTELGVTRSLVLRVGTVYASSSQDLGARATAAFRASLITTSSCLRIGRSVRAGACAGVDVGVLSAAARGVPRPSGVTGMWVAPNVGVMFAYAPPVGRAKTGRLFELTAETRLTVPLLRRDFVLTQPERPIYTTPLVGWSLFLGVSIPHA